MSNEIKILNTRGYFIVKVTLNFLNMFHQIVKVNKQSLETDYNQIHIVIS